MREIAIVLWVTLFPLATNISQYVSMKIYEMRKEDYLNKDQRLKLNFFETIVFLVGWYLLAI